MAAGHRAAGLQLAEAFPLWLAPEQVRVMTVSERFNDYARTVEAQLREAGYRATGDYRPEKIGYKVREAQLEKIPYMLVIGDKEQSAQTVAVRDRVDGDQGAMAVPELVRRLDAEVKEKRIRQVSSATMDLGDGAAKFAE